MSPVRLLAFSFLLAAGCSTIFEAREKQREVAEKGREDAPRSSSAVVDFKGMSLEQLVSFAMTNRPSMRTKRLAVKDARLAMIQLEEGAPLLSDGALTSPHISASGGYSASGESALWRDLSAETFGEPSAGLTLSVTLYDFGRYSAKAAAAREDVIAAELSLVDESYTVFADVTTAYFTYLEKAALLSVARTNEFEYAAHLEQADGLAAAGEAKRLDVLKARLNLASAREETVTASNAVTCAGVELAHSLGLEADMLDAKCLAALAADALSRPRRVFAPTSEGSGELYSFARTNAPTMRVARAQLRGARSDVDAAIADLLPEISASTSFNWLNPYWTWTWGVDAAQSLLYGVRKSRSTAVRRTVVALERAAENVNELEQQCSSDVATAVSVRDNAREKIATAADALREAKENLATVRAEYAVGSATRIDSAAAVSSYVTELGNHIKAFYTAELAEAALFRIAGRKPVYHEEIVR